MNLWKQPKQNGEDMRYVNAHPAPWEGISSKKDLKAKMAEKGGKVEFSLQDMEYGFGTTATIQELPAGSALTVTNHPKRSWFATVTLEHGKVKVV
jgi:hypothetical protein